MFLFYFDVFKIVIPSRCSFGISEIQCRRIRVTEDGIEFLVRNNRASSSFDRAHINSFMIIVESCQKSVSAKDGLFKNEQEKIVLRGCQNGEIGDKLKSDLLVVYSEGWMQNTINRTSNGVMKAEIEY